MVGTRYEKLQKPYDHYHPAIVFYRHTMHSLLNSVFDIALLLDAALHKLIHGQSMVSLIVTILRSLVGLRLRRSL